MNERTLIDYLREYYKNPDFKRVEYFVKRFADINAIGNEGNTCLHYTIPYGSPKVIGFLIENGADIHAENDRGDAPLFIAVSCARCDVVKTLCSLGVDVNCINNQPKRTSLHMACDKGYESVVKELLIGGADATCQDTHGWTPLHLAINNGNIEIIELLLENNVQEIFEIKTKDGQTAMDLANERLKQTIKVDDENKYEKIVKLLKGKEKELEAVKIDVIASEIEWEEIYVI